MMGAGYIGSHEFPSDSRVYYYLLKDGTTYVEKTLGGTVVSAVKKITKDKPLGQTNLFRRFAFLEYCTPKRRPLLEPFQPSHDPESFPDVAELRLDSGIEPFPADWLFCRDELGVHFVNFYRNSRSFVEDELAPRVHRISQFSDSFEPLMRDGCFFVPIIVIDEEQRSSVRNQITQFEKKTLFRGFQTAYLPSAASVLPPRPQGTNA